MAKKAVCDNCGDSTDISQARPGEDIPQDWIHVRTRGFEIERDYCSFPCAQAGLRKIETDLKS